MTPEERFTKIENLLSAMVENGSEHQRRLLRVDDGLDRLENATALLTQASRHLVDSTREQVESNRIMRAMIENHARRLEWLEGPA